MTVTSVQVTLEQIKVYCKVHKITVHYSTVKCSALQYSTLQYSTVAVTQSPTGVQYSTVQYSTVQCSTVQYSTVQYSTQSNRATKSSVANRREGRGQGTWARKMDFASFTFTVSTMCCRL